LHFVVVHQEIGLEKKVIVMWLLSLAAVGALAQSMPCACQQERTEALFRQMENRAIAAGRSLIAEERALDALFASRTASEANLGPALERIARAQAQVRQAHLEAHLAQAAILTPPQTAKYGELRGYASHSGHAGHGQRKH
jgi:Spy/CpxP family protein refolding chaperone